MTRRRRKYKRDLPPTGFVTTWSDSIRNLEFRRGAPDDDRDRAADEREWRAVWGLQ